MAGHRGAEILARESESEGRMRRAADAATIGFAALMIFQAALAAGAPLGAAAWGGAEAHLSAGQRVGSAISVLVYLVAIAIVRGRAAGRSERRYRWGTWALVVVFAMATAANIASESHWENYLLAPVALVLCVLCAAVARPRRLPADSAPNARRAAGRSGVDPLMNLRSRDRSA
jgi:hypothetical protein